MIVGSNHITWLMMIYAATDYALNEPRMALNEPRMTPAQIAEAKTLASEWNPVGAGVTAPPAA